MTYNPTTDLVGLWRSIASGVEKGEMPGLDFVVAALARAGILNISFSGAPPVTNQATTAWFQTASPSYAAEGALQLWNGSAYVPATPALFGSMIGSGVYLSLAGGTLTGSLTLAAGSLTLAADPTTALQAATKQYVDGIVAPRNYIVNGSMMVSQEWKSAQGIPQSANGRYPVDQFTYQFVGTTGGMTVWQVQSLTPGGSPYRLRAFVSAADAAIAAGDAVWIETRLEGSRLGSLFWGTAAGKTLTLRFGVHSALAGTYSLAILNAANTVSYVAGYTISAAEAGTDTVKTIVIPAPPVGGPWPLDTGIGIRIRWALMAGSNHQQVPGVWATGDVVGSPSQINFLALVNNGFDLFDVSLTEGTVAPAYHVSEYQSELLVCQRYFQRLTADCAFTATGAGQSQMYGLIIPSMRIVPNVTIYGMGTPVNSSAYTVAGVTSSSNLNTNNIVRVTLTAAAAGACSATDYIFNADARL